MPDAYADNAFDVLTNQEALAYFKNKMRGTSFSYLDVLAHEHAVAFTVAKMMDQDLLSETQAAITDAIANGTDFRDFEKRLKPYLMSKGWWGEELMPDPKTGQIEKVQLGSTRRLRTIYHTNLHSAYAAGQWERIQENKKLLPYLQYMPSVSGEPRNNHKAYYNLVLPVDDPIWQSIMPPNGYGCLCSVKQLTKGQARRAGITENFELETEETINPRTGKKSQTPIGITPSFDHNSGDRLGALMTIASEKHGSDFTRQLESQLDDYIMKLIKPDTVELVSFAKVTARQAEIERLQIDNKSIRRSEGVAGDEWQQYYGVNLDRYDDAKHKIKVAGDPADFVEVNAAQPAKDWTILDFMFTVDNAKAQNGMNAMLMKEKTKRKVWKGLEANIQQHLEKADIVPMDLRPFNTINRIRLLSYVLSLSIEQQKQIKFIVG